MSDKVQVVKPRTAFDRRLARIEQQRVWEFVGKTVLQDAEAIVKCEEYAIEAYRLSTSPLPDGSAPTLTMRLRAMSVCRDFMETAHRIRKETFQDRTIPTLARVEGVDVLNALPAPDDELNAGPVITDEEKARRESIALMRSAIALLERGGAERPGLVLLRREATS